MKMENLDIIVWKNLAKINLKKKKYIYIYIYKTNKNDRWAFNPNNYLVEKTKI